MVQGDQSVRIPAVGVERIPAQFGLDHKGRAVQLLRRPEDGAEPAVRDHEMMAHLMLYMALLFGSVVTQGVAKHARRRDRETRHQLREASRAPVPVDSGATSAAAC